MKRFFILSCISVFTAAAISTFFVACNNIDHISNNKQFIISDNNDKNDLIHISSEFVDDELPPESFVGTIISEDTSHIIVKPNTDEEEYDISKEIRVEFINDHIDYLYGVGRKVLITYIPVVGNNYVIKTDDIRTDGFEEFELSVKESAEKSLRIVLNNSSINPYGQDYDLYYYGLSDVYASVDGITIPLEEALKYGKLSIESLIADSKRLASLKRIVYNDSAENGCAVYEYSDFKIIKYNTADGNRDIYIGSSDMNTNVQNLTHTCINLRPYKDLGIRLYTKDVTPDGATVVFKQTGGDAAGTLQTGEWFVLERKDGSRWIELETNPLIDFAFYSVAYMINKDDLTELEVKWNWLYGSLDKGTYRIAKKVTDFIESGNFSEYTLFAYFDIQ